MEFLCGYMLGAVLGVLCASLALWMWVHSTPPAPDAPPQYIEGAAYDACLDLDEDDNDVAIRLLESCDFL